MIGRELKRGVLDDAITKNGWLCIDLLTYVLTPTHYTLRHYNSQDSHALRCWRLDGSRDGINWSLLRDHKQDSGLNRKGALCTWSLPSDRVYIDNDRFVVASVN
jgi:hypothetical protein